MPPIQPVSAAGRDLKHLDVRVDLTRICDGAGDVEIDEDFPSGEPGPAFAIKVVDKTTLVTAGLPSS
jgi:hypothetical protein